MSKESKKWLYSILVFLIGALLIAVYFLLEGSEIAAIFGLAGLVIAPSSIGVFYKFHDVKSSNLKMLSEEIKYKYQLDYVLTSNDATGVVGISKDKELLYLFSRLDITTGINEDMIKNQYEILPITYKSIDQINIIENDIIISKSTKDELVGKSVKGGFGNNGVGNNNSIQRIRVQVITDDILKPSTDIFLFNSGYGLKKNSDEYKAFYDEVNKWFNLIQSHISKEIPK